jgi:putative ragA protein
MNNKKGLLLILVFFPLWLLGQEMKIKGNVKDDEGSGMLGVSVVVKGTTKGVATDNDGNFELKVNRNDVLVFSSVGYTT